MPIRFSRNNVAVQIFIAAVILEVIWGPAPASSSRFVGGGLYARLRERRTHRLRRRELHQAIPRLRQGYQDLQGHSERWQLFDG